MAAPFENDLAAMSIPELQHAMNAGRLSSEQLTAHYLRRIQQLNPQLHAVITTNPDAVAQAQASDARRTAHRLRGSLDGMAVLLKDNIDTHDAQPTTAGSLALAKARPTRDAFLVRRLRDAGAVILGKANLSEWANFRSTQSSSGWSAVGGQTNNPYVLDRNACGSSSGPAVAAAADLATVTIGTETDGSILCPSGTNAVVGIKPTLGLISRSGVIPVSAEQDTPGPIARTVIDAAITLGMLTGVDPRDPATAASQGHGFRDYRRFLNAGSLHGARIGVWRAGLVGLSNVTDGIYDQAISRLHELGATLVDPTDLPYQNDIRAHETTALRYEFKHGINAYLAQTGGQHPTDLAGLIAFNREHAAQEMPYFKQEIFQAAQATSGDLSEPAYVNARRTATNLAQRSIDETLARHHLAAIIAPTNTPAWVTDLNDGDHGVQGSSTPAAVAGYPSVTVPMGYAADLPVGLSFIGSRWDEPGLIGLAYSFEQGTRVRRAPRFLPTAPVNPNGAGSDSGLPATPSTGTPHRPPGGRTS